MRKPAPEEEMPVGWEQDIARFWMVRDLNVCIYDGRKEVVVYMKYNVAFDQKVRPMPLMPISLLQGCTWSLARRSIASPVVELMHGDMETCSSALAYLI